MVNSQAKERDGQAEANSGSLVAQNAGPGSEK